MSRTKTILGICFGLVLIVASCTAPPINKLKVGDCVMVSYAPYKILSVGENSYLVEDQEGNKSIAPIRDYRQCDCFNLFK